MSPRVDEDTSVWFRGAARQRRAPLTLIGLPHAGGGASMFKQWQASLPAGVDLLAVQYPGHEGRWGAPLCEEMGEIVEPLARAIEQEAAPRYAIFGHSLGALIAFELAHAMRLRTGREPEHLFVSASRAPDAPDARPPIHVLPDAELLRHLRSLGGLPDEVLAYPALLASVLTMVRVGTRIYETARHVTRTPLRCPITALAGDRDGEVDRAQVDSWARHTAGPFEAVWLPGGHFFTSTAQPGVLEVIGTALSPRP